MATKSTSCCSGERYKGRGVPYVRIARRYEVVFSKLRHRKLTRRVWVEVTWAVGTRELLLTNLPLQRHEGMNQRFGTRGAAGDVHIHRDVAVDAFEHVVALLEGAAADGAGAHRDNVFRLRHLVVEPHDLGRHFLGHGAGDNHEVRLAR